MGVGTPIICTGGEAWLPDVAVLGRLKPAAMGGQAIVKYAVVVVIGAD